MHYGMIPPRECVAGFFCCLIPKIRWCMSRLERGSVVERNRLQAVVWLVLESNALVVFPIVSDSEQEHGGDVGVGTLEQRAGTNIRARNPIIKCGRPSIWRDDFKAIGDCPPALMARITAGYQKAAKTRRMENQIADVSAEVLQEFAEAAQMVMRHGKWRGAIRSS